MASEFDDLSKIRHVRRGDPVAEKPTAQPTRALELRLTQLEQLVSSLTSTGEFGRLVIRNVAIKTGDAAVVVDDVVYFNANTGLYEKALAGVTFLSNSYNSNPSSLVLGICVAVNGSLGDIMIAGYETWRDLAHKEIMLESTEDFVPGVPYYLSDQEAGKVTRFPPALRIQVFMGTAQHYILGMAYSNPDALEVLNRVPIGMRPVGGVRAIPPTYDKHVIVGFDGLELVDPTPGLNVWQLTAQSSVSAIANFGYLVADANLMAEQETTIYVRVSVAVGGAITVFSGLTLADLSSGGSYFNLVSGLTPLTPGSDHLVRNYTLQASPSNPSSIGTLSFKFVSDDTSVRRDVIFKIPDSFKGWKMINAPVTPIASAVVASGAVTQILVLERSAGYLTPPKVVISGTGTITVPATAEAVLDPYGSISGIVITNPGAGYVSASVAFDVDVNSVRVENGGDREAQITAALTSGEVTSVTIVDGGTGYNAVPSLFVTDPTGAGALLQAEVTAGVITAVQIVSQGSGYTNPRVTIRPSGPSGYIKARQALYQVNMLAGSVTSVGILPDPVTLTSGGYGHPIAPRVIVSGGSPTVPAQMSATVDPVTTAVTGISVDVPGSGYSSAPTITVETVSPHLVVVNGSPTTNAAGTISCPDMGVSTIRVRATGYGYDAATTIACSGGLLPGGVAAVVQPVVEAVSGSLIAVNVLSPGSGYFQPPTLVITDPGGVGNGFSALVDLDTWPDTVAVTEPGEAFTSSPQTYAGVPVKILEVEEGGLGYVTAPTVSIEPPTLPLAEGGRTATAVARLGGTIRSIRIVNPGSGYINPTVSFSGGGGSGADAVVAVDATGAVQTVDILNPGYDYAAAPLATVTGGPGLGAVLEVTIEAAGSVVRLEITDQGFGYTYPPQVTIQPPPPGGMLATAQAKLVGEGSVLTPVMNGDGGIHLTQTSVLTEGNRLQIKNYNDDLNDTPSRAFIRPNGAVFYYNAKADAEFLSRWPSVPVTKSLMTLNGTELEGTDFNETTGAVTNIQADVLFTRKTIMWTTFDADGCPWDREYVAYILDRGSEGSDAVIDDTGPTSDEAAWWRFWEHVFKYEPNRNTGHLHVNRASRFYQSGRLGALGTLAPLKLIDVITGTEARSDGTLMTGQLLLVLDNQVNMMGGTGSQIDTTVTSNIVPIYTNNTSRPVFISSVLLQVIYQLNGASLPAVEDAALITIGTQEGNYRDIIGTIDPAQVTQEGVSTRLYRINTVKELFPDDRESSPLIMPNQTVFLRVDYPVNTTTILSQSLVAKVKGHVF